MPPQPTSKQFLGIAKEAIKGTAEATPTSYIPIRSLTGGRSKTKLPDMSLRGSAVDSYAEADGVYHGTFTIEGDVFVDTFGHYLKGIFGEEAISGAGPYAHVFTSLNSGDQQPPGHTLWDNYSVAVRRYPGGQFTTLNLSWEDGGLLAYTAEAMTLADAVVAAPTASYGTLAPQAAWACTVQIGGGVTVYPLSGEMNISRANPEAVHVQDNSQGPRYVWMGAMVIEGSLVLLMEADTYYQQFLDNIQPILYINFATAPYGLLIEASKVTWRDPTIDRSGSYVKLSIGYKALGNTTDAGASGGFSPAKVTLTNNRSTVF